MKMIAGFDGRYSITQDGRVYSHISSKYLSPCDDAYGYKIVKLYLGKRKTTKKIHRLVAEAFLPNPEKCKLVLHGVLGKKVNSVENLRWGTYSDNREDAETFNERPLEFVRGSSHGNSKLTNDQVLEIYDLAHNSKLTQKFIGDQFGVTNAAVSNIKRGTQWSHITRHHSTEINT